MFIPPSFRIEDRAVLCDFAELYSFATLVSTLDGVPFATHVPLLIDRDNHLLVGHMARANPHWHAFDGSAEALAIFSGPHAYISPAWYAESPAVPTWNYAVVHIYGVPRLLPTEQTGEIVDRTVHHFEANRREPWSYQLPEDYRERLLGGIVAFEIPMTRIEGKFKLGQNRSAADRSGMTKGLRGAGAESELLADFIEGLDG